MILVCRETGQHCLSTPKYRPYLHPQRIHRNDTMADASNKTIFVNAVISVLVFVSWQTESSLPWQSFKILASPDAAQRKRPASARMHRNTQSTCSIYT